LGACDLGGVGGFVVQARVLWLASPSGRRGRGGCGLLRRAILSLSARGRMIWLPASGGLLVISVVERRLLRFWCPFWWLRPSAVGAAVVGATGGLYLWMFSLWVKTLPGSSGPAPVTH